MYNGDIHIPVLTLHTTGDGLVVVENESIPAETIAAAQTLLTRLETGNGLMLILLV